MEVMGQNRICRCRESDHRKTEPDEQLGKYSDGDVGSDDGTRHEVLESHNFPTTLYWGSD